MLEESLRTRADLVALRHARDAADSAVNLAKASRIPDLDVSVVYGYNSAVALDHPVDPTPAFHQLTLGFAIPLPLFDRGRHLIDHEQAAAHQAQVQVASAELKAEVEIQTAYELYRSAHQRVLSFENGILKAADDLLESRNYGYRRGANSLMDLIDAQRSDNQIHQDYIQSQVDLVNALIQLERTSEFEQGIRF
jgi:cobalt-zinc-cadmium efflux system outer membrane protein